MGKLTALAQLVDMYAKHEGVTSTAKLAELTGYSERSIWKAKAELRDTEPECTLNPGSVKPGAVHPEPECSQTLNPSAVPRARTSYIEENKQQQQTHHYDAAREPVVVGGVDLKALADRLHQVGGNALNRTRGAFEAVADPLNWIEAGADLERDIVPTIREMVRGRRPNSVQSWAFFEGKVLEKRDKRLRIRASTPAPKQSSGPTLAELYPYPSEASHAH